jgi:hypothetical protein
MVSTTWRQQKMRLSKLGLRPKPQSSPPRIVSYPRMTPLMLCFQSRLGIPSRVRAPSQELPRVAFCERRQTRIHSTADSFQNCIWNKIIRTRLMQNWVGFDCAMHGSKIFFVGDLWQILPQMRP